MLVAGERALFPVSSRVRHRALISTSPAVVSLRAMMISLPSSSIMITPSATVAVTPVVAETALIAFAISAKSWPFDTETVAAALVTLAELVSDVWIVNVRAAACAAAKIL